MNKSVRKKEIGRYRIDAKGTVQGVGFRPFVYLLANRCGLAGFVRNTPLGVELEVEGAKEHLEVFLTNLMDERPPASDITEFNLTEVKPVGDSAFVIEDSSNKGHREVVIPPDIATCEDCQKELFNRRDKRYGYPFINCTNCGPRYTIVKDIPYDRDKTTMLPFTMCNECQEEYETPSNRRFHAQPNACWACGPSLTLLDGCGRKIDTDDPIMRTLELINKGHIAAIKGIGGFHLAVDATRSDPVKRLRARKKREEKPFAIMSVDLESIRSYTDISPEEETLLLHASRPILLLKKKEPCRITEEVAPGNRYLGVMLPYTPLHHLLFKRHKTAAPLALVMTSANVKEEPIVKDNEEALERLAGIADCFLLHERDIHNRADDSVARMSRGKTYMIRRSRGYVPSPILLESEASEILACGAHLKNTVCLSKGRKAYLSQHIGDLENEMAYDFYIRAIEHLERILNIRPDIIAHDLHPDYLSTTYAEARQATLRIAVQHHHAHIASCLAENGNTGPVIGLSCDGAGLGDDGTIWGGEILLADLVEYKRIGHLETFPLPGGDSTVKEPWRAAFSLLRASMPSEYKTIFMQLFPEIPVETTAIIEQMLERRINTPLTSSLGRLFDAVSAMLGISRRTTFEGQAAIGLEMAMGGKGTESYPIDLKEDDLNVTIGTKELIRSIVEDVNSGVPPGRISLRFHNFIVNSLSEAARISSQGTGVKTIALSGGCFQNIYLLEKLRNRLVHSGFEVLVHSSIPPNDGGISLGQVMVAASTLKKRGIT